MLDILLNSYFNLKKINNNDKKTNIDLIKLTTLSFISNCSKFLIFNLIKKQVLNLNNKNKILKWKLKNTFNISKINNNNNLITKKSLKRLFVGSPYVKHSNNDINLLIFIFNKNKTVLKKKLNNLNILILKRKIMLKNFLIKKNLNIFKNSTNINILDLKTNIVKLIKYKKVSYIFKRYFLANIFLNKFKFNTLNLINLKNIIFKLYLKKININIVNMKYVYLENNILIDALTRKLNDRKKRVLGVLKKTLKLVKLAKFINYVKLDLNNNTFKNINVKDLYKEIINNLNNKHIIGIFLGGKGRLTRRMTASRAVYKLKYKGNMKNINLNVLRTFTVLKRGFIQSNVVYNSNNSYNKNGSFGVWSKVNTY